MNNYLFSRSFKIFIIICLGYNSFLFVTDFSWLEGYSKLMFSIHSVIALFLFGFLFESITIFFNKKTLIRYLLLFISFVIIWYAVWILSGRLIIYVSLLLDIVHVVNNSQVSMMWRYNKVDFLFDYIVIFNILYFASNRKKGS